MSLIKSGSVPNNDYTQLWISYLRISSTPQHVHTFEKTFSYKNLITVAMIVSWFASGNSVILRRSGCRFITALIPEVRKTSMRLRVSLGVLL